MYLPLTRISYRIVSQYVAMLLLLIEAKSDRSKRTAMVDGDAITKAQRVEF